MAYSHDLAVMDSYGLSVSDFLPLLFLSYLYRLMTDIAGCSVAIATEMEKE